MASEEFERKGLEHLSHIEDELEAIKDRTPTRHRAFIIGIYQGAGALLGGIIALALFGWLLSFLGFFPWAKHLQDAVSQFHR